MKEFIQRRFFVTLIFSFSLFLFLLISYISYQNTQLLRFHTEQVLRSNENLLAYESFISIMKDAETGQRGYLLTNDSTYLKPYNSALDSVNVVIGRVRRTATQDDSLSQISLNNITKHVRRNLFLLESNIKRRQVQGLEASIEYLTSGRGQEVMDSLRLEVQLLESLERQKLAARTQLVEKSSDQASFTRIMASVVSILLLLWAFWILRHQMKKRQEALELLEIYNQELETKVQARTFELQQKTHELATSNEEIIAGNAQLTASNTQLKQTLAKLDATQRQLELAMESARMGSWVWDICTGTIHWSGALEEIHGLQKDEFQTNYGGGFEGFQRLIHPRDLPLLQSALNRALQEKTILDQEFRFIRPDGTTGWMLGKGKAEYDEEGKALAMQGIGIDITQRKEAERALYESEQRYRDLFENNPEPMWIYDVDTLDFVEVNHAALSHFGYTKEEFFAKKATGLAPAGEMPGVLAVVEKVKSNGTYDRKDEWVLQKKDGSLVHTLTTSHALPVKNGQKTRIVMVNDITERKRAEDRLRDSEAKLRRLYEVGLMGVNYWRQDGAIIDSNDYFLQMIGYTREELKKGEINWRKLTLPGFEQADADAKEQINAQGFCKPYEKAYRCKDGHVINVLLGAASLENQREDGIAFLLDITERKTAEEQLRKSQILLQTIFEASADALFLINAETELIEQYNQRAVILFEFKDKQEYIGRKSPTLETQEFTEEERRQILEEILHNHYWTTELEYVGKKGRRFWGNVAISFFRIETQSYYLIRIRDVTERRAIYEEIKRSQSELLKEKRKTEQQLAIIEEDNKRKTRELEEAKELQLSMLPQEPPTLPNLALASYMKTCVEVGGDYYDYKASSDGTLTVIVGDATGHGLKAGILVATVKSYFQTLAGQCDVVEMLQRISEGIRNLQIRAMYMGVTVIEIRDREVKIASSGMPPIFLYRQATHKVESFLLKGPFLGSTLPTPYHHLTDRLLPGDSLLVVTDGLPELFNKKRQMLELPAIEKTFLQSAHLPPQQIVDAITHLADEWTQGLPNEDDITLLVVKAT